jgi:glycosyltransferase involved in cell wall biosynthesis
MSLGLVKSRVGGGGGPLISVMVPIYNRTVFLNQSLNSVICQELDSDILQVCVVDNSTVKIDWQSVLTVEQLGRIKIIKNDTHLGVSENFNHCIKLAEGEWVHILHDDDWVLPGFYGEVMAYMKCYPDVSLIATRAFGVDEGGVIEWVSSRVKNLESGGSDITDFYYHTPVQCSGVIVKKRFYEVHGGFRLDMNFVLDREMWARVVHRGGGVVSREILACYRTSPGNGTCRAVRNAENLEAIKGFNQLLTAQHPGFDYDHAMKRLLNLAYDQARDFTRSGDAEAAKASLAFWVANAPKGLRLRRYATELRNRFLR